MATLEIFVMDDIKTTTLNVGYVSFGQDGDLRSPRTPMWTPPTPSSPFEYDTFLQTPESKVKKPESIPPPPDVPLPWVWQCHLCRNRYPLGVTRRCLYDGHYYCSGDASQPNLKKKKGRACSSEFDYEGWEEYADWKQKVLKVIENPRVLRGCETCAFPSQCRTPAALFPPKKEKTTVLKTVVVEPEPQEEDTADNEDEVLNDQPPASTFDSILRDLMRDEKELLPKELLRKDETPLKRSESKDRNFSKKFSLAALDEEETREDAVQSLSELVMPMFDILSGKSKAGKGKAT